jgi:hypothetical protein
VSLPHSRRPQAHTLRLFVSHSTHHALKGEPIMDQIWKTAQINKLHHRELMQQAEQERLARLALQISVPQRPLMELVRSLVKWSVNLRFARTSAISGAYESHKIVIENE